MQDSIFITGIKVDAIIGIYPHERTTPQAVVVDLELATDIAKAAQSQDLADTLDYEAIANWVIKYLQASEFLLVEALAEDLANQLLETFAISELALTLHKPDALDTAGDVGIKIKRTA